MQDIVRPVKPPTKPAPPPPAAIAPPAYVPAKVAYHPGKGLGIASLILTLVSLALPGLILGMIALRKSHKANLPNGFATAAILLGIIHVIASCCILFLVLSLNVFDLGSRVNASYQCTTTGMSGIVTVNNEVFECHGIIATNVGNKIQSTGTGGSSYNR